MGTGESVGQGVAEAVRGIRASGLPNETNALFTTIEGEWDEAVARSAGLEPSIGWHGLVFQRSQR